MKLLKKLKEQAITTFRTDILGEFKNVLLIGENEHFQSQILSELNQYFNVFHIYSQEQQKDQNLLYQKPYDNKITSQEYLSNIEQDFNENLKTKKKIEFDAILNFANIPVDKNLDQNYLIQNQNYLQAQIERNLIVLQLTKQHLAFKGSLINVVDFPNYSGESNDIIQNLSVGNQMDLFYRLSNVHQDIQDHRFLYLITEDQKKLQNQQEYHKEIVKIIFKWILRRGIPEDNSIIHFKQKTNKKIWPEYLQIICVKKQEFLIEYNLYLYHLYLHTMSHLHCQFFRRQD